jgi:hypothetical protein
MAGVHDPIERISLNHRGDQEELKNHKEFCECATSAQKSYPVEKIKLLSRSLRKRESRVWKISIASLILRRKNPSLTPNGPRIA